MSPGTGTDCSAQRQMPDPAARNSPAPHHRSKRPETWRSGTSRSQLSLVIGGTGSFGRRLVSGLIATSDHEVVIAARDLSRAQALADEMNAGRSASRATATRIDVRTATAEELNSSGAFLVVDAAGPFQTGDYRLARAAIAAKMHYVNLADARDLAGFTQLDNEAKAAGTTALTGASSTPALSNAVLDRLTKEWREVESIEVAISPGNQAPRGLAVIQSILSYAGRPVKVFLDGGWTARAGWGMTTRKHIRHLGRRWLSLCETPDLDIIVARFAPRRSAIFRAGCALFAASRLGGSQPCGAYRPVEEFAALRAILSRGSGRTGEVWDRSRRHGCRGVRHRRRGT